MRQSLSKKDRRVISRLIVLWVFLLAFLVPHYAYAYIDPATTTYIIQVVAAVVITVGLSFSLVLYRFRMFFTKLWIKLTSGNVRNRRVQATQTTHEQQAAQTTHESQTTQTTHEQQAASGSDDALKTRVAASILEGSPLPPDRAYGFVDSKRPEYAGLELAYKGLVQEDARAGSTKEMGRAGSSQKDAEHGNSTLKGRFFELVSDQRSFKHRLGLAALASAGIVFTLMLFGPLELFATSRGDMQFVLDDFLGALLLVALLTFLLLTAVLMILRGRLFDYAICIVMGLLVASYVQAAFFNGFLGQLDGETIAWQEHRVEALLNLALWIALVLMFFVVRFLNTRVWQVATVFVSSVLIGVQLIALFSLSSAITTQPSAAERNLVLTTQGTLELSSQQNVIVFLLDKLDTDYIKDLQARNPNYFADLEGFTFYSDNLTRYSYTYPSIAYSLTGLENDYVTPSDEYLDQAYGQHLFVDDLVDAGWNTKLYLSAGYDYKSKMLLEGRATNLVSMSDLAHEQDFADGFLVSLGLVQKLNQLSALRYAPTGLKSLFWMDSSDVSEVIVKARKEYTSGYLGEFMNDLTTTGLRANVESPVFVYYHLDGAHRPFYLDANGYKVSSGETDPATQAEGCFAVIFEYIRQLKELGLYDDACIIITADHGVKGETLAGLFYKPGGSAATPFVESTAPVSDDNLVPTIVAQAGVGSTAAAAQGLTYPEVTEENTPQRSVIQHYRNERKDYVLSIYTIKGRAAEPENWHLDYQAESGLNYWMNPRQ